MRILTSRRIQLQQLVFSPDGQHLAGFGFGFSSLSVAPLWRLNAGELPAQTLFGNEPGSSVYAIAFTSDGRGLLTARGGDWVVNDLSGGLPMRDEPLTVLRPSEVSSDARVAVLSEVHGDFGVLRVRIVERRASGWADLWQRDIRSEEAVDGVEADTWEGFSSLRLTPDGRRLLICFSTTDDTGSGRFIRVLDTNTGADVFTWRGRSAVEATDGVIGRNGQIVFGRGRALTIFDPARPDAPLTRANSSRKHFTAAAFSPDGKLLATTSNDATVTMWDTATWEPIRQYAWDIGRLRAVAFAPDGLTCAAGSDSGQVVLFDVDG